MLRAAERLSAPGGAIHIVIGAETVDEHAELECQARLLASDSSAIAFEAAGPTFGFRGADGDRGPHEAELRRGALRRLGFGGWS